MMENQKKKKKMKKNKKKKKTVCLASEPAVLLITVSPSDKSSNTGLSGIFMYVYTYTVLLYYASITTELIGLDVGIQLGSLCMLFLAKSRLMPKFKAIFQ